MLSCQFIFSAVSTQQVQKSLFHGCSRNVSEDFREIHTFQTDNAFITNAPMEPGAVKAITCLTSQMDDLINFSFQTF